MKKVLFFDTETTGKWDFKADISSSTQPSIVQIAALLYNGTEQVAQFSLIVKLSCIRSYLTKALNQRMTRWVIL